MKLVRVFVIALACIGFVMAQADAPVAKRKAGIKPILGTVVSVDAVANTIIVTTKKGEDTFAVDTAAKIMSGKTAVTLGDLKTDSKVAVFCKMVDGKKVAMRITEFAAKAESAPAPAPAAQ